MPVSCAFEEDWCGWTYDDDYDWAIGGPAGTPSSSTGPSADHTTGTGYYVFTESSGQYGVPFTLESPTLSGGSAGALISTPPYSTRARSVMPSATVRMKPAPTRNELDQRNSEVSVPLVVVSTMTSSTSRVCDQRAQPGVSRHAHSSDRSIRQSARPATAAPRWHSGFAASMPAGCRRRRSNPLGRHVSPSPRAVTGPDGRNPPVAPIRGANIHRAPAGDLAGSRLQRPRHRPARGHLL